MTALDNVAQQGFGTSSPHTLVAAGHRASTSSGPTPATMALLVCTLLLAGCSGSDGARSPVDDELLDANDAPAETPSDGESSLTTVPQDQPSTDPVVPDLLARDSTRVEFDIEVPVYRSDALEVRIVRGDTETAADWIGDEFWSASADFPTATERSLVVTFLDRDGGVTLGSFEAPFRTGTNASESYRIGAADFDTARWDDDGDGTSNLDELVAGTFDTDEQAAFERYVRSGGGHASVHVASDTEYDWPWYGDLVGAWFDLHPAIQPATQVVEDGAHPSTAHLGRTWTRTDEWYDYRSNPRSRVNVLLRLDEDSYGGGGMGDDHPSAWYHDHDGGRSWYTGGGHTAASYAEPDFRTHLPGGLRYAAGREN